MWYLLLLFAGFFPLIYGANLLVDNASSLAKRFNIPNIVIGLTIVAFGTSAPELVVNIFAAVEKNPDIVMGNVIGSNIFNVGMILAISAIIYPLAVKKTTTWIEVPLAFLAGVVVFILASDQLIDKASSSVVTRSDGLLLLLFFLIFLAYNYMLMLKGDYTEETTVKNVAPWKATLLLIAGLALLVAGGRMIVYGAVQVASSLGISQRIIALTIVSAGTSLPELATSIVAARKKNTDIAVGNIVGSNIFNIFLILGASAVIYPVTVASTAIVDMGMNLLLGLLVFLFIFTGKGRKLEKGEGIVMLILYLGYLIYLIMA